MIETTAIVLENHREFGDYWRLRLRLSTQVAVQPGQFAMIRPQGQLEPILRRAMAFYRVEKAVGSLEVEFVYRVLGRGTNQLARLHRGDRVDFLGPLGNGFPIDESLTPAQEVVLVSGGIGIPALYLLACQLRRRNIATYLFHGDRTGDRQRGLICIRDFSLLLSDERIICTTEDGSYGEHGLVTAPLEAALRAGKRRPATMYACGPRPMMQRVAELAREFHIPAYVSLEAPMACGFGVCLACVERVKLNGRPTYVRVCLDGPIFRADDVVW